MAAGYIGILAIELHFPEAGSLKGKRKHVLSAKAQLQNRFGATVAEVDHHEQWQRCGGDGLRRAGSGEAPPTARRRRALAPRPGLGRPRVERRIVSLGD